MKTIIGIGLIILGLVTLSKYPNLGVSLPETMEISMSLKYLKTEILQNNFSPEAGISFLKKLGFSQTSDNQSDQIVYMLDNLLRHKKRLRTLLLNHRYLVIGFLFNMPGIYLIGGGGGISLACGISRNISFKWFLLTVVLAVSPVPLLAFFGVIQLEAFF